MSVKDEEIRQAVIDTKNHVKESLKVILPQLAQTAVHIAIDDLVRKVGVTWMIDRLEEHPEDYGKALLFAAFVSRGADPNEAMRLVMGKAALGEK